MRTASVEPIGSTRGRDVMRSTSAGSPITARAAERSIARHGGASATQHTSTNAALGIVAVSDSDPTRSSRASGPCAESGDRRAADGSGVRSRRRSARARTDRPAGGRSPRRARAAAAGAGSRAASRAASRSASSRSGATLNDDSHAAAAPARGAATTIAVSVPGISLGARRTWGAARQPNSALACAWNSAG